MNKVLEVPAGEYDDYIRFINTPGLVVPAGKTLLQYYLECKGQRKVSDYGFNGE